MTPFLLCRVQWDISLWYTKCDVKWEVVDLRVTEDGPRMQPRWQPGGWGCLEGPFLQCPSLFPLVSLKALSWWRESQITILLTLKQRGNTMEYFLFRKRERCLCPGSPICSSGVHSQGLAQSLGIQPWRLAKHLREASVCDWLHAMEEEWAWWGGSEDRGWDRIC